MAECGLCDAMKGLTTAVLMATFYTLPFPPPRIPGYNNIAVVHSQLELGYVISQH